MTPPLVAKGSVRAAAPERPSATADQAGMDPALTSEADPHGPDRWVVDLVTRTGVPLAGGVTAATAQSPWLLLAVAAYSALVDPASPFARALSLVLEPAADALGQAVSIRIRRWGRAREQTAIRSFGPPASPDRHPSA